MQKVTFLAFVVILTCFSNGIVRGKEFPEVWKRYIQTLCQRFNQTGVLMPRVVSAVPDYDVGLIAVSEPLLYLMPPVLMWSPMEQYSDLFPNGVKCPKCNSCGNDDGTLSCIGWKDGSQGTSAEPRVIHDVDRIMLLVGRVYWCINNHCYNSYCWHNQTISDSFTDSFPTLAQNRFHSEVDGMHIITCVCRNYHF